MPHVVALHLYLQSWSVGDDAQLRPCRSCRLRRVARNSECACADRGDGAVPRGCRWHCSRAGLQRSRHPQRPGLHMGQGQVWRPGLGAHRGQKYAGCCTRHLGCCSGELGLKSQSCTFSSILPIPEMIHVALGLQSRRWGRKVLHLMMLSFAHVIYSLGEHGPWATWAVWVCARDVWRHMVLSICNALLET